MDTDNLLEWRLGWDAVTAIATLIAAVVVWWQADALNKQLRLQNQQLKLQNYSDYTKRYQEIVLNFPEDINDPNFDLTRRPADYDKTMRYMRAYFDLCFEEWDLNRRGLVDEDSWKVWSGGIETAMAKTAFQQAWLIAMQTGTKYGPEFSSFVEKAMRK